MGKKRKIEKVQDPFAFKKLELVDAIFHNDLILCFRDDRSQHDMEYFVQHVDDWLSDDVYEQPSIVYLCMAQLQLYRYECEDNPLEISQSEDDNDMYNVHETSTHSILEQRLTLLKKCVIHSVISLKEKDNCNCVLRSLSNVDVEKFSLDSDADEVVSSIGAEFADNNSKKIFEAVWKHGDPAFKEVMSSMSKENLVTLSKKWSDLIFFRMNREKQVRWTFTTDFFLRWQTRWSYKVWQRCLQISFFVPLMHLRFPNPLWNPTALNIIDLSLDESERCFQEKKVKDQKDEVSFDLIMKERCHWPLLFMNLIREFAHYGLKRWAHVTSGISLMFNALMTEMGYVCAREFVSDVL